MTSHPNLRPESGGLNSRNMEQLSLNISFSISSLFLELSPDSLMMLRGNPPKSPQSHHQLGADANPSSAGSSPTPSPSIPPHRTGSDRGAGRAAQGKTQPALSDASRFHVRNTYNKSLVGLLPGAPSKAAKLTVGKGLKGRKQIQHYAMHV